MKPACAVAADWWRPEIEVRDRALPSRAASAHSAPDASPLAYAALVAFTCSLLLAPQNVFPVLGKLRIVLLAGAIAIVAHVRDRWGHGLPMTKQGREMTLAAALLAWAVVTIPFSLWPGGSLALLLDLYVKALAVFWLIGNLVDTPSRLRGLIWTLASIGVALAIGGVSNYVSGVFGQTLDRRIVGYDAGLTRNPNDLALMINLIIPMAVALLLSAKAGPARAALVLALPLLVVAVILTFSRTGFVTLAATLGLYGLRLLRRPGRGFVIAALIVACLGLPFVPAAYVDRLLTLSAIDADPTGSARARWSGTVAALEHAVEHPVLGAGIGMNILVLNESVGRTWTAVHNTYLEHAVDLGLPGLFLFALLLRACWRSARAARRSASRQVGQLAEGIEISLFGFAVAALFHPSAYQFYFFYVAGLAVAAKAVADREAVAA